MRKPDTLIYERFDGGSFTNFALLELSIDGKVKVAINGFCALTIKDAQRAKVLCGLLWQPGKLACSLHEARYTLWNKNVLCITGKNYFVEHIQMLAVQICCNELASANGGNV